MLSTEPRRGHAKNVFEHRVLCSNSMFKQRLKTTFSTCPQYLFKQRVLCLNKELYAQTKS